MLTRRWASFTLPMTRSNPHVHEGALSGFRPRLLNTSSTDTVALGLHEDACTWMCFMYQQPLIPHMFWIDVFDTFTCSASFLLHSCLQPEFSSHTFVTSLPVVLRSFLTTSVWLSIHISPLSSSALALTAIHAALSAYLCADDN